MDTPIQYEFKHTKYRLQMFDLAKKISEMMMIKGILT